MASMTAAMRDLLIEHIDGPIQVRMNVQGRASLWKAAFAAGLICAVVNSEKRPRHSRLTEGGRKVLARELGNWADALVRAGYDVKTTPKWSKPDQLAA